MLKKIQEFFESQFLLDSSHTDNMDHKLNLAAAALLLEMMFQDEDGHEDEHLAISQHLMQQLDLTEKEATTLIELATEEKHQATDYHQFTTLIARHYTQAQKIRLIESLWQVAYADQVLDKYEEHMVRKICDLIHVSHKDFLQAKHRVEKALGGSK